MRSFAVIGDNRATMMQLRNDGDVTVFDRDRESPLRFRIPMHIEGDTTWRLLSRVMDDLVCAEQHQDRSAGGTPQERMATDRRRDRSADSQHVLRNANFAIDAITYPDHPDFYSPPTLLMGIGTNVEPTGKILWIDAHPEWAVCDDGFWWTPEENDQ